MSRTSSPDIHCPLGVAFLTNFCPRNSSSQALPTIDLGFVVERPVGRLQGLAPTRELVRDPLGFTRVGSVEALLGFVLSRASSTDGDGATYAAPPLLCFAAGSFLVAQDRPGGRTPESCSTAVLAFSLSRAPFPPEVSRLLRSHRFGNPEVLGYRFPSKLRGRCRSRPLLFGPSASPAGARCDR